MLLYCAHQPCQNTLDAAAAVTPGHGWVVLDWLGAGGVRLTDAHPDGQTTALLPLYFCRLLHVQQFLEAWPDGDYTMAAVPYRREGPLPLEHHPREDREPPDCWLVEHKESGTQPPAGERE